MSTSKFHITTGAVWHGVWNAGKIEPNRRLYDFELVWFSSGKARVIVGNEVYECLPGSVIIIPPEAVHCTVADSAVERWCIHFDWYGDCRCHDDPQEKESYFVYDTPANDRFVPSLAAAIPDLPGVTFPHFCRSVPGEVYKYIRDFFSLHGRDVLGADGSFLLALSGALNSHPHTSQAVSVLLKAKSCIDREFSSSTLTASAVAESCGITVNYLNRLFKETFGVTTTGFIISRRLEYAETLLADSGLSIKMAAEMCGFNDHNYFIRLFKAKKGITPGTLRKEKA